MVNYIQKTEKPGNVGCRLTASPWRTNNRYYLTFNKMQFERVQAVSLQRGANIVFLDT